MDASLLSEFPCRTQPPPGLEAYGKQVESKEDLESDVGSSECSTADTFVFDNSFLLAVPVPKPYEPGQALRDAVRLDSALIKNACKLDLERVLPEHASGSLGCPSVGSAGHHLGLCKPCDFMYRTACRADASCKFCHLCPPGETQRRKKHRKAYTRLAAYAATQQSWLGPSMQMPTVPAVMLPFGPPISQHSKIK